MLECDEILGLMEGGQGKDAKRTGRAEGCDGIENMCARETHPSWVSRATADAHSEGIVNCFCNWEVHREARALVCIWERRRQMPV